VRAIHRDILAVLAEAFKENIFVQFVPEIKSASFLGPDPDAITTPATVTTEDMIRDPGHDASRTVGVVFSLTILLVLLKVTVFAACTKAQKTVLCDSVAAFWRPRHTKVAHAPLPVNTIENDPSKLKATGVGCQHDPLTPCSRSTGKDQDDRGDYSPPLMH
jgi:hypothetical protein